MFLMRKTSLYILVKSAQSVNTWISLNIADVAWTLHEIPC